MAHDVFISYSSKDKPSADAVCAVLESKGIRCWIAPRDILPGRDWGESILDGLSAARVFILVFSSNANTSPQIKREVERAVHLGIPIIPVRIEDVPPARSLEYYISTPHWLDAFTPPLERHLNYLCDVVRSLLDGAAAPKPDDAKSSGHAASPGRQWGVSVGVRLNKWRLAFTISAGVLTAALVGFVVIPYLPFLPGRQSPPLPTSMIKSVPVSLPMSASPHPDSQAIELAYWSSVSASNDPVLFEDYLKRYPNGAFTDLAHARIAELKKAARTQANAPPQAPRVQHDRGAGRQPAPDNVAGIWRSSPGMGVADFGGGRFARYRTTLNDLHLTVVFDKSDHAVDGNIACTATEISLDNNIATIPANQHSFTLTGGEIVGKTVTLEFHGAAGNKPPANARFTGTLESGGKISGTLSVERINNGVVLEVLWTIAVPLALTRQ